MVSWLPPSHPKAVVTKSAAQMRRELEESQPNDVDVDDAEEPITDRMDDELSNTQVREVWKLRPIIYQQKHKHSLHSIVDAGIVES